MNITEVFTKSTIEYYKNNKNMINFELLNELRQHGNDGKQIALEILDLFKDHEAYYLDAYGNRISYDGNRRLKKSYVKLQLSPIHFEEMQKCSEDIYYYMDNYVKIRTQTGINFPDLRIYQREFIDIIIPDENEDIASLQPRQSGKSITVAIYLSHVFTFSVNVMVIGIAANKLGMAKEFLNKTKNILIELPVWMQQGLTVWNTNAIEAENGVRIMASATNSDSFRGFTCNIVVVDETAFISPSVWSEFSDSIFPSQSGLSFKKRILISTANGLNHFYNIVKGARNKSNGYKIYEVDWKDVPRYDSKGEIKDPEDFKNEVINNDGIVYFNQNFGNEFYGSSHTLISSDSLIKLTPSEPIAIWDNKLNIYKLPEKGHQYIMSVDAAKDGKDEFSLDIIDITNFEFEQVASSHLQIDYLLMPEFLYEWAKKYYNPYMIIENNEGAGQSIADQLYQSYGYSNNMHFDRKTDSNTTNLVKSRKRYPGARTTSKSRKQILQTLKTLIENNRLKIHDAKTINQFFTFILHKNKYQADEGYHDDKVMSLALGFTIFNDTKNFEDMKKVTEILFGDVQEEKVDITEYITVGSFDDGTYEDLEYKKTSNYEEFSFDNFGF